MKEEDFTVECNCCKQWYDNWIGSTPCCGSIASLVNKETGQVSGKSVFFSNLGVVEVEFKK